jgi:hypothetical protein
MSAPAQQRCGRLVNDTGEQVPGVPHCQVWRLARPDGSWGPCWLCRTTAPPVGETFGEFTRRHLTVAPDDIVN